VREGTAPEPPILVSACLLGVACNHRGLGNRAEAVVELGRHRQLLPVCPEVAGGLPTPRPAAEIQPDGAVRTATAHDVSGAYRRGAAVAVEVAEAMGITEAVLKARSPSCGCHEVYDGTFTRAAVPGEGVTARALREAGVSVRSEEDLAAELGRASGDHDAPGLP